MREVGELLSNKLSNLEVAEEKKLFRRLNFIERDESEENSPSSQKLFVIVRPLADPKQTARSKQKINDYLKLA